MGTITVRGDDPRCQVLGVRVHGHGYTELSDNGESPVGRGGQIIASRCHDFVGEGLSPLNSEATK